MFISLYLQTAVYILCYMSIIFILAIILKNNSIVDIAWGFGFIIISLNGIINNNPSIEILLINSLVWLWGLRLSLHILLRNLGKSEDFRYNNWRKTWKNFYLRSFLQIFMLQGIIMLVIAMPIIKINTIETFKIGFIQVFGIILFITGFLFESIADYQLLKFKKDKENIGKIIKTGLWKYSRHPNYFGETILWWGFALIAINGSESLFVLLSPILITLLLIFVSGIPMLEKKYKENEEFKKYAETTPVFIPNFYLMLKDFISVK